MTVTHRGMLAVLALATLAASLPAADLITTDETTIYKFDLTTGAKTVLNTNNTRLYTGVTADGSGGIFVADNNSGNIYGFTDTGASLPGFTTITPPSGYFPEGITYNPNTNLLTTANSAGVSEPAKNYATTGGASVGSTVFNVPASVWSLAYDASNNLYTTANSSGIVSKNGTSFITLPGGSNGSGQFLATDATGLYVSYNVIGTGYSVRKYDFAGNQVAGFTPITSPSSNNMLGVFVHDGILYVTNRNTIGKYDPTTGAVIQANWVTGNPANTGATFFRGITVTPNLPVPEPSTYALAAIASGVLALIARRRKARGA